eukprot:TRINITY_DN67805_c9_g3_i1.p1 TRINITY_DN67805_c9_g3~~TRINITY_DN67805_c9_g3_i1.p1  ORF type:complete len:615 (+),score=82.91 TRINITY_DN67805_c9_g3_i1:72-1916(+)
MANSPSQQLQLDEVGLEASRKQKIRNLQLKTICLENEEYVQELHVTDHSQTQKAKLDAAHEKAFKFIQQVEAGTRWNLMQAYDLPKLLRFCGLNLNPKELFSPTDQPQFMDIVALKKTLQELKQHRNKNKVVSMSDMIDKFIARLDDCEQQLRHSQLDATEIANVPAEALKAMEDCMNVSGATMAMASNDERIKHQLKLIERSNEVQNIALADGEMQVAEEQYYTKISLLEMLLELINNKFTILEATAEENKPFARVIHITEKAKQNTSQLKEAKKKLKDRCEQDLQRLLEALQRAELQDAESTKKYSDFHQSSDEAIYDNLRKQDEAWNKIQELERQLQKLGTERFEEVKRRLEETDREEKRKVEYAQFLEVIGNHRRALELTIFNCDVGLNVIDTVEELVEESVTNIRKRHDVTNQDLAEMKLEVHKEQLEGFRQLYLTLGQLRYKKEKKLEELDRNIRTAHIQLEFCVETFDPNAKKYSDSKKELYTVRAITEDELEMIKEKMDGLAEQFKPTEEALGMAGIEFLHPSMELTESNLHRRSRIIEYKLHLAQPEEVLLEKEKTEIKRQYHARSPRGTEMLANPPSGSPTKQPPAISALPISPQRRLIGSDSI